LPLVSNIFSWLMKTTETIVEITQVLKNWGTGGRGFESRRSDQQRSPQINDLAGFDVFALTSDFRMVSTQVPGIDGRRYAQMANLFDGTTIPGLKPVRKRLADGAIKTGLPWVSWTPR
jgi:hypothetical protein